MAETEELRDALLQMIEKYGGDDTSQRVVVTVLSTFLTRDVPSRLLLLSAIEEVEEEHQHLSEREVVALHELRELLGKFFGN